MKENSSRKPWIDPSFFENQRNFPPEELDRFAGQHIAWSHDGLRILASGVDLDEVIQKLDAAGIATDHVVFDFVDVL